MGVSLLRTAQSLLTGRTISSTCVYLPSEIVKIGFTFLTIYQEAWLCLFVLLLYAPNQQLWSWQDGQFIYPHFFLGKLEQAVYQYFVHILSHVTDNNPS